MSFWEFVWFIFISYCFFAYLMLLFAIFADIFRDKEMSGIAKGVWMVCLIFLPFISALVYVIARGSSMAERSMQASERKQQEQEEYIRRTAGRANTVNPSDQIAQAKALLDAGAISGAEYENLKTKALV
jgi:hypothetical protein